MYYNMSILFSFFPISHHYPIYFQSPRLFVFLAATPSTTYKLGLPPHPRLAASTKPSGAISAPYQKLAFLHSPEI